MTRRDNSAGRVLSAVNVCSCGMCAGKIESTKSFTSNGVKINDNDKNDNYAIKFDVSGRQHVSLHNTWSHPTIQGFENFPQVQSVEDF